MNDCPCKFPWPADAGPWSAEAHRAHKAHHLAVFPVTDLRTIKSLDTMVTLSETHAAKGFASVRFS